MKVVVDTNVLVSGLLSPDGSPGKIVRMILNGVLRVCFDGRILAEYDLVLKRSEFAFVASHVTNLLTQIVAAGESISPSPIACRLPDSTDEPFLEVSLAAQAECLITGNLKHFPLSSRQGVRVLPPREFLDFHRDRQNGNDFGKVKSPSAKYSVKRRTRNKKS